MVGDKITSTFFKKQGDNEYHTYLGYVSTTMSEIKELSDNVYYEFTKGLNAYNGFLLVNSFYTGKPVNRYFIRVQAVF